MHFYTYALRQLIDIIADARPGVIGIRQNDNAPLFAQFYKQTLCLRIF